ncbi:RHS repeat-associated core domain-containing protein [Asanoa siamensis]|uniref:RHS repeat-associated core domain-containing protein n=1 Tax=Asanoa siamensis TaxID=926357 RepID=A0ABQ4CVZ6_9ACTN|nr:RHS repeat-associated core domain-containing protein [Asanoa siamensis]GIF75450.1 hypothetical protein Asi02nite_49680 [Asanoa siamensis]
MNHAHFRRRWNRRIATAAALILVTAVLPVPAAAGAPPTGAAPVAATAPDCSPTQPDAGRALAVAAACGKPVEDVAARTETQEVFAQPGGGWTAKLYAGPLRMRDAGGRLVPIDLSMRAEADGSIAAAAHPANLRVSGAAGAGEHELFSLDVGPGRAGLSWRGALPRPVLAGNRVTYPEVRPGVDLVVEASRTGARQFLVVKRPAAAKEVAALTFPVRTTGVRVRPDHDGGLVFTDDDRVVGVSAKPEMWDSSAHPLTGQPLRQVRIPTSHAAKGTAAVEVRLAPARSFFDDPATTYPVIVDPHITQIRGSFDTYVRSDFTTDRSAEPELQLGRYPDGPPVARSFVHWNVAALRGKRINSAAVNFFNYHSASCAPKAWEIWSTGPASTATRWTSQPSWNQREGTSTTTRGYNSTCVQGWASVNATTFFARAAAINQATAYMGIRATDETDILAWKRFRSGDAVAAGEVPFAEVNYGAPPSALNPSTLQPGDAAETETRTPLMRAVFSDPDGDTGRVDYEIYDRTGATLLASGAGGTVASGAESTWTVPGGELVANTVYKWRARGNDGTDLGPWSAWRYLATSDGSPTGEQGRFSFQELKLTDRLELKVNVANGNLLVKGVDLRIRGTGTDLTVDRYYNSRSTAVSVLGTGWTPGTGQGIRLTYSKADHATADVTYHAPSGFTAKFVNSAANAWRTPPSIDAKLTRDTGTGELRLKFDKSEGSFFFADSTGRLLRMVDRNNNKITYGYDGSGNVTTITDTQGRISTLAYASGRLTSITDPTSRRVSYTYNGAQNLETVTDAGGGVTRFDYDGDRLTRITTPEGRVTNLGYEPDSSRMLDFYEQTNPGGTPDSARYTFTYHAGRTEVTDPNGVATSTTTDGITTHTYETRDRVTKVKDALGHEQSKKYNANDNVETFTDALTNNATFGFDPNTNNLTSVGLATGATSTLDYNNTAHPHAVSGAKDPQGNAMSYSYDVAGNKTAEESSQYPGQKLFEAEYNTNGTVKWQDDGKDVRTSYAYDTKGNLTKVDNPAPLGDVVVVPDALSRLSEQTDGKGQKTRYTYDHLDRVDTVTFQGGVVVDYTYDKDGNLTRLSDPTGVTVFSYDRFGRPTGKQAPGAVAVTYDYDRNGNVTTYTDAGGAVTYGYNAVNLVTSVREPGASQPVTFTYDENNRRRFMYLPTSPRVTVEMKYDRSGRQTSIVATNDATGTKLSSFSYDYTKGGADTGLRHAMTDLAGTTTYSYDKLNRLTGASGPGLTRAYAYDANNNRTSKTENGTATSYGYNDAHQLTSAGSATYTYDANGNTTGSSTGWQFTYNSVNNQTTEITAPGRATHAPISYAGPEQTERRRSGSVTYVTSALGVASATSTLPGPPGSGAAPNDTEPARGTTQYFTRDPGGNLIGLRTQGSRYYYLVDGLGSVVGLVDGTATKVNSYSYDPYGNQLSASQQVPNPWRYAAGMLDGPTGLTKFGARYYDPALGRFSQRDPSGQDLPYGYAGCNPVNNTDPTGLSWQCALAEYSTFALAGAIFGALGFGVGGPAGATIGFIVGTSVFGGFVEEACAAEEDGKDINWADVGWNILKELGMGAF